MSKFTKEDMALVLHNSGMSGWIKHMNVVDPVSFLRRLIISETLPDRVAVALCRFVLANEDIGEPKPSFFMVYREGGNSPTFKHETAASALAEAKRIGNESGSTTHVLAVVETYRPHAMPTAAEFATHAEEHAYNESKWGLWRVVAEGRPPAILCVRVMPDGMPYASADSPGGSSLDQWKEAKWFPLASDGSDLKDDDIPF